VDKSHATTRRIPRHLFVRALGGYNGQNRGRTNHPNIFKRRRAVFGTGLGYPEKSAFLCQNQTYRKAKPSTGSKQNNQYRVSVMCSELDTYYMQRALNLAAMGLGSVSPNPLVGCVIVHQDQIIGEGYHKKYGFAHAEVNAINSVKNKELLVESTAYVTLEPCSHHGKTPPCAELLIKHGIKEVVIAQQDPYEKVNGSGIAAMRAAGIKVKNGCLEEKAVFQNRRFTKALATGQPYVILKWAQSSDGFMNLPENLPTAISGELAQILNHKWRTEEDAILVGYNTALIDNPSLTARKWPGKNPHRYVIDKGSKLPKTLGLFTDSESTTVLHTDIPGEILHAIKHQSIIIEGGAQTLNNFIAAGCFDEIRIFTADRALKNGLNAPKVPEGLKTQTQKLGSDTLSIYYES
jgi:diaminohydroxyphosphoribosylaminopyrimidine deaminase / 5-amino-6-(5-phosphoribosylamino)uracil reductase